MCADLEAELRRNRSGIFHCRKVVCLGEAPYVPPFLAYKQMKKSWAFLGITPILFAS